MDEKRGFGTEGVDGLWIIAGQALIILCFQRSAI